MLHKLTPQADLFRPVAGPVVHEIVLGKRGVTADTAVRLAAALGTSERFWLGLQADFDLEVAHRLLGKKLQLVERIAA